MRFLKNLALALALTLLAPAHAAVFNWSNDCTTWHFNPANVRDPTIVFNNTSLTNWNVCPGYDNTQYAFKPCNWAPTTATAPCGAYSDDNGNPIAPLSTCPAAWVDIPLDQFGVQPTAKQVLVSGRAGTYGTGPNMWNKDGTQQIWFRAPGSPWNHSPAWQVGYLANLGALPVPVANVNGVPTLEMAWALLGLSIAPNPNPDTAYLNLILVGWCE